jgi:hypothetical protein
MDLTGVPPNSRTTEPLAGSDSAAAQLERRFGRCALRFQRCEHLAKLFVAHQSLAGPMEFLEEIRATRIKETATKTFGSVAGDLLRSCVVPDGEPSQELPLPQGDVLAAAFAIRLMVSPEEHARLVAETKALVGLRNDLTHHFLIQYELGTAEGCRAASAYLAQLELRIDTYLALMDGWADQITGARERASEFVGSEVFREWVANGIAPDGTVHWTNAGCVRALREAATVLAVDGWTRLDAATARLAERAPEQTPQRYGCRRWREVLHKSTQFHMVYREQPEGGRVLWFRPV